MERTMKHTKEPWVIADDDVFVEVMAGGKTVLPAIRKAEAAEDFRRIVACVNACEGLDTELLETIVALGGTLPRRLEAMTNWERSEAEKQRNDLTEAIRLTLDENGHLADGDVCTLKRLKDALAKVSAGETATEGHNAIAQGREHSERPAGAEG